jgi:hypothetical protein
MNARADSPFDACLKEALVLSAEWVPRWLDSLYDTLQQREAAVTSLHDKQAFAEARSKLESHRQLLSERYLSMLTDAVLGGSLAEPAAGPSAGRSLDSLSFDDLELMDHDQVQETVEIARVQQVVKMSAEEEFVAFNARLNRAQGLAVVHRQAKNPLAPDAMVKVLIRALATVHLSDTVRARWLAVGAVALGQELEKFYRRLTDQLDRWGVQPAGFQVVQKGVPVGKTSGTATRHDSVPAASQVGSDALLTLDHLHQLLTGNLDEGGQAVSDHGASGSGNAMVRTLASEVVTLMLRGITEDPRLLKPVRELLAGLKPALLQLARTDPRFFAERHNPARRLLNVITTRGLAFTSEQDAGFADYAQQVQAIVQDLQAAGQNLPGRFPPWLLRLHQSDVLALAPARGLAMKALVKMEQRNLLAERVAGEIQSRNDFARAPGVVRRFLTGPWAQVVAQARMLAQQDGSMPPSDAPALRYMDLLPDLLWSSQLALASRNRPRLIKVIPGLLRTLREGLDSIDFPRAQAESFFQALMGLHEAAYKTQHAETPAEVQPSRQDDLQAETWAQPAEARDSGFMDDLSIDTAPAFLDTEPLGTDWHRLREAEQDQPLAIPVGTWVDLCEDHEVRRCQLTWASPHRTLYLFNDARGRSRSLSHRGVERLQELGRLRVVADHGLVEDALDGVARQALDNSGRL